MRTKEAMEKAESFAERLNKALELLEINQKQFADALNIQPGQVSQWTRGISVWNSVALATAQIKYPNINFLYVTLGDEEMTGGIQDPVPIRTKHVLSAAESDSEKLKEALDRSAKNEEAYKKLLAAYKSILGDEGLPT